MGGFLPLAYVSTRVENTSTKGHLFPGLSWQAGDGAEKFRIWLTELDASAKVVIFDTGKKGNALGAILRQVRKAEPCCRVVHVCILAEREPEVNEKNRAYLNDTGTKLQPIVVPCNYFEDRLDLLGYEAMRGKGYVKAVEGMEAIRIGNSVVIGDPLSGILKVMNGSSAMRAALQITGTTTEETTFDRLGPTFPLSQPPRFAGPLPDRPPRTTEIEWSCTYSLGDTPRSTPDEHSDLNGLRPRWKHSACRRLTAAHSASLHRANGPASL